MNAKNTRKYRVPIKLHMQNLQDLADILGIEVGELPHIFQSQAKRALKIGFREDLIAAYPDADKKKLHAWMAKWTNTHSYLYRITIGTNRHDLDGNDCGLIEDRERGHARSILDERDKKWKARKNDLQSSK